MGVAKVALQGGAVLGYSLYVGGIVIDNLPLERLLESPPIAQVVVPTVVVLVALIAIEALLG